MQSSIQENDNDNEDKVRKSQIYREDATKMMHSTKGSKKVHKGGSDPVSLDHGPDQNLTSGRNGRQI